MSATARCPHCGSLFDPWDGKRRPLTLIQRQIVDFLKAYNADCGYMPTLEDIAARFGYNSLATVHEHLTNLERKGWITRAFNEARAIVVTEPESAA